MAKGIGKKVSNIGVWIIMGLLLLALAGFGVTSFTGGSAVVGRVGSADITSEEYFRALEGELRNQAIQAGAPVRLADLSASGIDQQILARLIARAALLSEAREMGLSVGDATVADQIRAIPNFQSGDGFNREAYEFELARSGLSPAEFETDIREDTMRTLLQVAIVGGIEAPDLVADRLAAREVERRDFTLARITEADLTSPIPDPTATELQSYYDDNGAQFERPERRVITYAWLTPDMILDDITVDEDQLRALYDAREAEFNRPERRLVERLVFPSLEDAETARAALDAGETDFDTLVEDRGLSLDDIDMGDVARTDLSDAAADAVFADPEAEIVGPVESAFGPALFRINAVLEATSLAFEDVRFDLSAELAVDDARRDIAQEREPIEDALAGGAALEDLADETLMQLGQIEYTGDIGDGISAYDAFRAAAEAVQPGDFEEVLELSDGGLFALRLDDVIAPTVPPLAEIEDEVSEAWRAAELRATLETRAQDVLSEIATSGARLEDLELDLQTETGIGRQDFIPEAPFTLVAQVYDLASESDLAVVPGGEVAMIVRLDAIQSGNVNASEVALLRDLISSQVGQTLAQDVFEGFGRAMQENAGLTINQRMIDTVHLSFP